MAIRAEPTLNLISLCTGGGGLDRAVELAIPCARPIVCVEREAFSVANLVAQIEAGLMAPAAVWSNVRTFNGRRLRGLVDGLIGGIPCQGHSLAGRRQGSLDERDLWTPARRIIAQARPWFVLIENVGGMLSAACSRRGLTKSLAPTGFEETYESWVTRSRLLSSERTKWVSRTNVFGSSSLASPTGSWPTATATDGKGPNPLDRRPPRDDDLATSVMRWPTATANDAVGVSPNKRGANNPSLPSAATTWPTASARDWKGVDRQEVDGGNARPLNEVASAWATPNAHDGCRPGADLRSTQGRNLNREAATWPTPTSLSFAGSHQPGNSRSYNKTMELAEGLSWSTPSVADVQGGRKARSGSRSNELLNNSLAPYVTNNVWPTATALNRPRNDETLAKCGAYRKAKAGQTTVPLYLEEAALSSDLLAPETSTPGDTSPSSLLASYRRYRATTDCALRWERRALLLMAIRQRGRGWTRKPAPVFTRPSFRRQLNARFVEWLMSWPPGLTSFECSETALRTHKALWRSELALMTSLPAARPAQLSLFG